MDAFFCCQEEDYMWTPTLFFVNTVSNKDKKGGRLIDDSNQIESNWIESFEKDLRLIFNCLILL